MEQIKLDIRDIYKIFSNLIKKKKKMMQNYFKNKSFKVDESKINYEDMSYVSTVNQVYDLSKQINNNNMDIEKIKENLTFFEKILDSKIIVDEANLDVHYKPQCSLHDLDEEKQHYKKYKKIKKPKMKVLSKFLLFKYKFILRQFKKQLDQCENKQKYIESIIKILKIHKQSLSQQKNNFTLLIKKLFANISANYDIDKIKKGCIIGEDEYSSDCELSMDRNPKIEFRNTPAFQVDTLYLNFGEISFYTDTYDYTFKLKVDCDAQIITSFGDEIHNKFIDVIIGQYNEIHLEDEDQFEQFQAYKYFKYFKPAPKIYIKNAGDLRFDFKQYERLSDYLQPKDQTIYIEYYNNMNFLKFQPEKYKHVNNIIVEMEFNDIIKSSSDLEIFFEKKLFLIYNDSYEFYYFKKNLHDDNDEDYDDDNCINYNYLNMGIEVMLQTIVFYKQLSDIFGTSIWKLIYSLQDQDA